MKEKSTHFSMALSCLFCTLCLLPGLTFAQLASISITSASFTSDVIAEGSGANIQSVTSTPFDGSTSNTVLYTKGFQAANSLFISAGGLPNSGTITNGSDTWQLQAYTGNNCLFFPAESAASTKSLTLTTASKFSQLALLTAAGNGPTSVNISFHFTNGSSDSYGAFSVGDWFGGSTYVINALGRITRSTSTLLATVSGLPNDPRLYQITINLTTADQLKTLDRIDITDNSTNNSSTAGFFAVSATFTILALGMEPLQAAYSAAENEVDLKWNVSDYSSDNSFEVQRSSDGVSYTTIGTIHPLQNTAQQSLTYTDQPSGMTSLWFYRVKEQSSASGEFSYSNVISVSTRVAPSVNLIQAGGSMHLSGNLSAPAYEFELYNSSGQQLYSGLSSSTDGYAIPVSRLLPGVYVLRIRGNGYMQSIEFFRQKE